MDKPRRPRKVLNYLKSDDVYGILKERIFRRDFEPGQKLDLNAMQKELGVSSSPLKQALHRLMLEGLVEIKPQSGTYITEPTHKEVCDLMGVRHALEVYAAGVVAEKISKAQSRQLIDLVDEMKRLRAENNLTKGFARMLELDKKLHELIQVFADNAYLMSMWRQVEARYRTTADRFRSIQGTLFDAVGDHEAIVTAIVNHDKAEAVRCMDRHMMRAMELTLGEVTLVVGERPV